MPVPHWKRIDLKSILIISFALVGLFAVVGYFTSDDHSPFFWLWGAIGWFLLVICMVANEYLGRRSHERFIHDRRMRWFYEQGFTIENKGDYWGLKGIYKGYFCRLFFNWDTFLENRFHELTMQVYFSPILNKKGNVDIPTYDRMNKYLKPGSFSFSRTILNAETAYIIHHTPFIWATSRKMVRARLEKAIEMCVHFKLEPISEEQVETLVKENPYLHGPDIDVFQENFVNQ